MSAGVTMQSDSQQLEPDTCLWKETVERLNKTVWVSFTLGSFLQLKSSVGMSKVLCQHHESVVNDPSAIHKDKVYM